MPNNKKELTGNDHLTYYGNHFLSTDEGKEILSKVFKPASTTYKGIQKQLEVHKTIMDKFNNAPQVALNNDQPLVPPMQAQLQPPPQQNQLNPPRPQEVIPNGIFPQAD